MRRACLAIIAMSLCIVPLAAAPADGPPAAPLRPVTDDYFGTKLVDPYRWMENRTAPEFVRYMQAQGTYARRVLDAIPGRDALEARIAAHTGGGVLVRRVQKAAGRIFFLRRRPSDDTYKLFMREGVSGPDRLLVDPDRYASGGQHAAIDYYQPSWHGEMIAVGISSGGSEHSVIHIMDVASQRMSPETIDRAENGGISWLADASAFFYNRMAKTRTSDPETARYLNSRAYLHRIGSDPDKDVALVGTGVAGSPAVSAPDIPFVFVQPGSDLAFAGISHGSETASEILVAPLAQALRPGAHWRKICDSPDGVINSAVRGDTIYLLMHKDAPRYRIVALNAATLDWAHAQTVVPESARVIEDIEPAADGLYILDLDGGLGRLRRLDTATGKVGEVTLPGDGTLDGPVTDPLQPGAIFAQQSWLKPQQWYADTGGHAVPLALAPPWKEDLSGFVSEEIRIAARDGTKVPLSIVHRRDFRPHGKAPLWLTGYGAYGITFKPRFAPAMLALLEDGGVYAVCHVRGGGEFGEAWHVAGMKATKPNTWRDLVDCALYLQAHGYAAPQTTAIEGGSAGGITVGMAMVERPDLFRVVFSDVGDSNALRAEFETDGDANALEYGSVKTPAGFRALAAADALSHVKEGVTYPAALFTTGLNDPHVAPWQPGKMAARLQRAMPGGRPVLLRVDRDAGHGAGPTKQQQDRIIADQLAFFYWQIGKPGYRPVK